MTDEIILLADGGGGTRTKRLIDEIMVRHLGNDVLSQMDDAADLVLSDPHIAFTTDSFVVKPVFFPGGDIGKLAVCGTVNDLAMQAAKPAFLSFGLILEEGFRVADLDRIVHSMAGVLSEVGARVVTGDTKVVERGAGLGIAINTSGIGLRVPGTDAHVSRARPGDVVLVTGTLGDHGIAVMATREGLRFEADLVSDVAPLWDMVRALLTAVPSVRCLRDPTRGGLAAALCDIAHASSVGIRIREPALPVRQAVAGACRMLGLDVLNVPNEGNAVIVCPAADADAALRTLRSHPRGRDAVLIGEVCGQPAGTVLLRTAAGGERIVDLPSGENLPRIC